MGRGHCQAEKVLAGIRVLCENAARPSVCSATQGEITRPGKATPVFLGCSRRPAAGPGVSNLGWARAARTPSSSGFGEAQAAGDGSEPLWEAEAGGSPSLTRGDIMGDPVPRARAEPGVPRGAGGSGDPSWAMHVCMDLYMCVCVCTCVCIFVCACVYTCVYIYVYMCVYVALSPEPSTHTAPRLLWTWTPPSPVPGLPQPGSSCLSLPGPGAGSSLPVPQPRRRPRFPLQDQGAEGRALSTLHVGGRTGSCRGAGASAREAEAGGS